MTKEIRTILGKAQLHTGNVHSDICKIIATDGDCMSIALAQILLEEMRKANCQIQLLSDTLAGQKPPTIG